MRNPIGRTWTLCTALWVVALAPRMLRAESEGWFIVIPEEARRDAREPNDEHDAIVPRRGDDGRDAEPEPRRQRDGNPALRV